jgi:hypothetical protein
MVLKYGRPCISHVLELYLKMLESCISKHLTWGFRNNALPLDFSFCQDETSAEMQIGKF